MKVLIIGGTGAFGCFYAKQFAKYGFDVAITGRDPKVGNEIAQKNGLNWDEGNAIGGYDIIILSVPNEAASASIKKYSPKISDKSLIVDFCSVKREIVKTLSKLKKRDIEIASIHPMHGPRISSLAGQPVACIDIKHGKKLEELKKFFVDSGANFFNCTAEEHDKTLSVVQGLTHYSQFVSAAVLKETELNLKDTMRFSTPNYSLFISGMARVILQNPELYSQIQLSNPNNEEIRRLFSIKAREIEKLCSKGSSAELEKYIICEGQLFKDPDAFLVESDRAANSFNYVISVLKSRIGDKVVLENMITHSFHHGIVKAVIGHEIILVEGHVETKLNISKLRLLTKNEAMLWKNENLKKRTLDFSFLVPNSLNAKILIDCFTSINDYHFELVDEFKGPKLPEGQKSLTLRANFFSDDEKKEIDDKIKSLIIGLGFTLR